MRGLSSSGFTSWTVWHISWSRPGCYEGHSSSHKGADGQHCENGSDHNEHCRILLSETLPWGTEAGSLLIQQGSLLLLLRGHGADALLSLVLLIDLSFLASVLVRWRPQVLQTRLYCVLRRTDSALQLPAWILIVQVRKTLHVSLPSSPLQSRESTLESFLCRLTSYLSTPEASCSKSEQKPGYAALDITELSMNGYAPAGTAGTHLPQLQPGAPELAELAPIKLEGPSKAEPGLVESAVADQLRAASAAVLAVSTAPPQAYAALQSQPVTAAGSLPAQQQHALLSAPAPKEEAGGWTVAPAHFAAQAAAPAARDAAKAEAGGWTMAPAQFAAQAAAPAPRVALKAEAGGQSMAPAQSTSQAAASVVSGAPQAEAGGWSTAPAQFAAQVAAPATGIVSGPASTANGALQVQDTATLLGSQAPKAPVMASAAPQQQSEGALAPAAQQAPGGSQLAAATGGTKPALAGAEMQAMERHADGRYAPVQCWQRRQEHACNVCFLQQRFSLATDTPLSCSCSWFKNGFTKHQMDVLRNQIFAFRSLKVGLCKTFAESKAVCSSSLNKTD